MEGPAAALGPDKMVHPSQKAKGGHLFEADLLFLRWIGYLEIVGHLEDPRHTVGANASDIFVGLAEDHSIQGDVAIHNRDADGLRRIDGIFIQAGVTRK